MLQTLCKDDVCMARWVIGHDGLLREAPRALAARARIRPNDDVKPIATIAKKMRGSSVREHRILICQRILA
jgi:hypothetical protein